MAPNGFRIHFQNASGINKLEDFSDVHEIRLLAEQFQVGILGLAETNLDWRARDVKTNVQNRFKKYWKQSAMAFTSSDYRFDFTFQPGGAMMVVRQPWAARSTTKVDERGLRRWEELTLIGRENCVLNNNYYMRVSGNQELDLRMQPNHGLCTTMASPQTCGPNGSRKNFGVRLFSLLTLMAPYKHQTANSRDGLEHGS